MKKEAWMVHISLMNGNQQHYHFTLTPQEFDNLREAAEEAYRGMLLPGWMEIELDKIMKKMLKLSDHYYFRNHKNWMEEDHD